MDLKKKKKSKKSDRQKAFVAVQQWFRWPFAANR